MRAPYWSVLCLGMAVRCIAATIEASTASNADACAGAEIQLKSLSTNLNRNQFSVAEDRLTLLKAEHPGCSSILLAEARIKASQGAAEASDLFSRYLEKVPNDPAGLAYFARFLIDQGQYIAGMNQLTFNDADPFHLALNPRTYRHNAPVNLRVIGMFVENGITNEPSRHYANREHDRRDKHFGASR